MADKNYVVSLTVDDSGAVAAVNQMTTALDKADTSTQSLKAQLRQMQQELQKLDIGSEEFQKLSIEAGKLKDQINDASEAVRANAGNAFEGLSNNAVLLKDRLFNLDLEGVGQSFKGIAANIKGISFKEIQSGISALGSGLASIGKALLTNPLFLLAAAIGAAIAYSDELLSLVDGISAADEKQLNAQKEKAALATQQLDTISAQEEILKEQGKTEAEITDLKQQALDIAIKEQEIVIATQKSQLVAQVQAAQRNKDYLIGVMNFLNAPSRMLLEIVNKILDAANLVGIISDQTRQNVGDVTKYLDQGQEYIASLLFDPAQVQKDGEAAIKESETQLLKLQNQAAGFRNKERAAANKAAQQAAEDKKKRDEKQAEEDRKKQEQAEYEAQFLAQLELEQEEQLVQNKLDLEKRLQDATLLLQQDAIAKQKALDDFALQSMQEGIDKELAMLAAKYDAEILAAEGNAELQKAITQKYQDDVNAINEDAAKKAIELERSKESAKRELALQGLNVLGDLTALFNKKNEASAKRAFQIQKGISIATAVVETYKGANAIFTAAALNPASVLFPAQPYIAAGIAISTGLANVAKIAAQKFEGGGAQGGGGGGVPSLGGGGGNVGTVPAFNAMNLGFLQNRPEQTPKAYVLAQDVSSAVEARDKVRDLARIN